jgi:uncharacterized protein
MAETIRITVAYAQADRQILREVELPAAARVADALALAALDPLFADIDLQRAVVGIFGQRSAPDSMLQDGDRVEIYRPLTADPKAMRRARAQAAKVKNR